MIPSIRTALKKLKNVKKAKILSKFFKTGKGEYGEGDIFLGIDVPTLKKLSKAYGELEFKDIDLLICSPIHEERMVGLFMLVNKFQKENTKGKKNIVDYYLSKTQYVNNWDLVDSSADKILGEYLFLNQREQNVLMTLAASKNLWERRIAIISTYAFIKKRDPKPTLMISKILLNDKHDLIHKAVGWMLREVGKRIDQKEEEKFLALYYKLMPRTSLRYAIERFPEILRQKYLKGRI